MNNKKINFEKEKKMKNVENKLEESLPKELKLNDLENIKMIAKFMNKLTLSEQRRVNFPKAIELLVALHESDRIIENKNKICVNKNLIYSKKGKGKIEEIEEYLRDIVNIKKEDGKKELFVNALNSLEIIESGYPTIKFFEFLIAALPHLVTDEKIIVENMKETLEDAKKWVEISIEYMSQKMSK
uniref:CRISPR type III-B/RAMP module-associated protein Cmr5 n=1 Tax=Meloidogyne incognita TaxID=6306 RepID=A0A914NR97_MELIC